MKSTIERTSEEEVLKILSEQAPVGACIIQDGKFCYINSFFSSATGYTVDELVGKDSLEIVVPEDRAMVSENTVGMLKAQLISPYQFRVTCRDGSVIWVMATVKSIQYHGRRAILGNYMEITGRKQMEEALQEREDRYRELANSITDVFFAMDTHLRYTYWNKASEILTGIRAEDALGKYIQEIFPDKSWRRKAEKVYRSVLKTQQPRTFVNDYDINGRHYVFEISAYPSRGGVSVFVKDITEHKQAEAARREAEEEKSALLEEAPVAIIHTDLQGKITYVNERFEAESGYSREESIGKEGLQLDWFPADTTKFLVERMAARLRGDPAKHWETQFKCKDGQWIWIELEGKVLRRLGVPVGFQIIASNITERKRAEEALRQSEERYRTILEETGDGYFETDLAGNFVFANDAQARLLGYSKEEIIGTNYRVFTPEEKAKSIFEAYKRMYKTGEPLIDFPDEVIRKDGSHGFAETSAFPIQNDKGEIVGFRGVRRDITEQKQAEEALRRSEERYRNILEEMEDSYFEVDLGGHFTFVNNSVCRDLGYSKEELIGMSYKNFTAEEDVESVFRVFNEVYQTGTPNKGFPWKVIHKDGIPGVAEASVSLLRDDKGEIIGFRGVGRDVTDRKRMEEALQQSEENYRALFDSSVIGAVVVDAETMQVVMANEAAMKMFGFSSKTTGVNPLDFVPPEDREKNLGLIAKEVFEKDSRKAIDLQAITKDGRKIWVSATGARIMHKGRLAGLFSFTDITERKQAEEALRQSEENYKTLFNSSVVGMYVMDAETMKVVMGNRAAREIIGFSSAEEGIGVNPFDFVVPEDREKVLEIAINDFLQDSRQTHEIRVMDKNGRRGWQSISIARIMHKGRLASLVSFTDITERKQMEEALQAEKNKLQSIIDAMQDDLTIQDTEYNVMFQNEPARINTGGDQVGQKCYRAYEGNENICEYCPVEKSFKDGKPHISERQRVLPSGGLSFWETISNPILDANGRIIACLEIGRNITERKKQEQALADELTRRRLLIDQSIDGIVVLDADAKVVEANHRFAEMLGYTLEEVHKLHTWDWDKNFPPEKIMEMGRNVDEKGLRLETKHTRKDGSVIDVDISINGATFAGQKLIFCVCRDVTASKKMAEAVKLAAQEWSRTFDSISDAISIHDKDFRILRANKAFADLFRKGLNEIINIHCYELHKGNEPRSGCPHQRTLTTGKPAATEFYESNLGKYLLESTSPIFNDQGEVVATVHITRDITEQKRQNERLMMTDRLASLGELAAGTAHELNNPLTSIIGFSQLLMEREVPDDIRDDLKLINNEAQRAANVTRNLLTFARKHTPVKQLNHINSIIEDILKLRAHVQKNSNIEIERYLAPDLPEIMVDYFQMQQVFMNIIINAEYFMTEAHNNGTLTITTKKQNKSVMISFADDGPGIPRENLNRIFDPFFTTKEAGKGTGLGLSICHGIVTEHGGQIYVRSQLGKGATIFIELPIDGRDHIKRKL